jgi:Spy/CpxP family protein refolding chaperone
MKLTRLALSVLALALASSPLLAHGASPQDQPKEGAGQPAPARVKAAWEKPPEEFNDVQRQGFHDGVDAARDDFQNQHPQDAEKRNEFHHAPGSKHAREQYLEGFRTGYDLAFYYLQKK